MPGLLLRREFSRRDKRRFYRIALRSATESAAILDVCRRLELDDGSRLEADLAIIGAGPAGITIAATSSIESAMARNDPEAFESMRLAAIEAAIASAPASAAPGPRRRRRRR